MVALIALVLSTLLSGCDTARYYRQAVTGHCRLVLARQPIGRLLSDPATSPELKSSLNKLLALREFARTNLALPVDGHYLDYVALDRRHVVWNVYAAPEFAVEAHSWWYPLVGRQDYRGYFREADAHRYAMRLAQRGFDVCVGGVDAYSTVGWFKDPVLSTFWNRADEELADLLFHELAHQRVFAPGDSDFNEAFATTVAREGVRRWLMRQGDRERWMRYQVERQREEEFVDLVTQTRARLELLYGEGAPAGESRARALRHMKQNCFEDMRRRYAELKGRWDGDATYDRWFSQPLSNAHLNTIDTYHHWVPAFERLLIEAEGELTTFYRMASHLRHLPKAERDARLNQGLGPRPLQSPLRPAR
jgi:predicted aminopeptidase